MKTAVLAGTDNTVFLAADLLNPMEYKLVGYATTIEEAWNIYDENGGVREEFEDLPVMPPEAVAGYDPDVLILAALNKEDDTALKFMICRTDFRGEVISLFELNRGFSVRTAVIRRISWRLGELGVEGAAADIGAYLGDLSWQMNALMPDRKLYLFDTFTGYDRRDVAKEKELGMPEVREGEYSLSSRQLEDLNGTILGRMPYPEQVVIRAGWFPETARGLEDEKYAFVHIDTGLYAPTYSALRYFIPRMSREGIILAAGYTDGRRESVHRAVADFEREYGALLLMPVGDLRGSAVIVMP